MAGAPAPLCFSAPAAMVDYEALRALFSCLDSSAQNAMQPPSASSSFPTLRILTSAPSVASYPTALPPRARKVLVRNAQRQGLWGAVFEGEVPAGARIRVPATGERAGVVTSALPMDAGPRPGCQALLLLRRTVAGPGLEVEAYGAAEDGEWTVRGITYDLPFATRDVSQAAAPPSEASASPPTARSLDEEKSAEELRKEAKLAAMQAKLDAFKRKKNKGAE